MGKKIAIVDIDGTLVPESHRLRAQVEAVMSYFHTTDVQEFVYRFFLVNDYVAIHNPEYKNNISHYFVHLAKKYNVTLSPEALEEASTIWEQAYHETNTSVRAFPGAEEFLKTLKSRGYEIIAASGGSRESRIELLEKTGLCPLIDEVLAAEETGFQKQQAGFWDALKARFPQLVTADRIVMIGNQLNDDAIHPLQLGYEVFIVEWPGEIKKVRHSADSSVSTDAISNVREQVVVIAQSLLEILKHPILH